MIFSTKPLTAEVTDLIQSIWCYQEDSAHVYEQVLPGVSSQLLINLHENELRHWSEPGKKLRTTGPIGVQGVLTEPVIIDTKQKRNICGVAFTEFGLSAFCKLNASRFSNSIVDASELWGHSATVLRLNLLKETDPAIRCLTIEKFLVKRLRPNIEEDKLMKEILSLIRDGANLSDIRKSYGLSQRRLHALFDKRIGVRPKTYERVDRFSSTLEPLSNNTGLTQLAFDSGFADQSHFNREFQYFSGLSPTQHSPVANERQHAHIVADKLFKTQKNH